jgi:epoxyqueuosine reductase
VLIAIGNSGDAGLRESARALLEDASPLVRAMAIWASSQLLPTAEFESLRARFAGVEVDPDVQEEWIAG